MNKPDRQLVKFSIQYILRDFVAKLHEEPPPHVEEVDEQLAKHFVVTKGSYGCLFGILESSDLTVLSSPNSNLIHDLVLSTTIEVSGLSKNPIALVCPGQSNIETLLELLANLSQIPKARLNNGEIEDVEWEHLVSAMNKLNKSDLFIFGEETSKHDDLEERLRNLNILYSIGTIIIDSVDSFMPLVEDAPFPQKVLPIIRSLSSLSRELDSPIVVGMRPYLDYTDPDFGLSKLDCFDPSDTISKIANELFLIHSSASKIKASGKKEVEVVHAHSDRDSNVPTRLLLDYEELNGRLTAKPYPTLEAYIEENSDPHACIFPF